jgi:hypothetical protein
MKLPGGRKPASIPSMRPASSGLSRVVQAHSFNRRVHFLKKLHQSDFRPFIPQVKNRVSAPTLGQCASDHGYELPFRRATETAGVEFRQRGGRL